MFFHSEDSCFIEFFEEYRYICIHYDTYAFVRYFESKQSYTNPEQETSIIFRLHLTNF